MSVRVDPGLLGNAECIGGPTSQFDLAAMSSDYPVRLHCGWLRTCAVRIFDASSLWPERLWFWFGTAALVAALAALPSKLPAVASIDATGDAFSARVSGGPSSEERPRSGSDLLFGRANIRFCRFQQVRLEAIGPLTRRADLAVFQALASDWNARCASYRYLPSDKRAVDAEAVERREALEGEGRALLDAWRRRIHLGIAASAGPSSSEDAELRALPPLITLGVPGKSELEPVSRPLSRAPSPELLRPAIAARVQRRLNDLGYSVGSADGTWGTSSRIALRHFKAANALLRDDVLDAETAARLFSTSAVEAAPGATAKAEDADAIEAAYPPPTGARMNPLNRDDAEQIQRRLAELGYYAGAEAGLWGAASRNAVRAFRTANRLSADDEWDAATEQALDAMHVLPAPAGKLVEPHKSGSASAPPRAATVAAKRTGHPAPSMKSGARAVSDAPRPPAPIPERSVVATREP